MAHEEKNKVRKSKTASLPFRLPKAIQSAVYAVVFVMLLKANAFGQAADGNLVGSILDSAGASVAGATVEAQNVATAVKSTTTSDSTGFYRFNNLLVGEYRIKATSQGLAPGIREVVIELNKTATANVELGVEDVTVEITVNEEVSLIDTTTAQIANNYVNELITDLPLAANPVFGGVWNLSLLGAGVASSGGAGVGIGPSIGGQRPRNNNFMVEGADNNSKSLTGPVVNIPVDAVKEFSVLQNQFSAEFGHSSGGQFNAVVMSGTNRVHGTLFEYFQNRKLNALDQSAKRQGTLTRPRYDRNIVGGNIGGPIKTGKLFYFGHFEYNPLGQQSTPSSIRYAPTSDGYALLSAIPGLSQTNLGVLKQYVTPATAMAKFAPINGSDGIVYNVPLGTFQIVAPNYTNEYRWVGSLDYTMSPRDQWRGRYVDNKITRVDTAANLPVFFQIQPERKMLISISEFHAFSPTLLNELRLAFNRSFSDTPAGNFKFPGLDVFPSITLQTDLNLQLGPNPTSPQKTIQNTYQLSENINWFKTNHDVKFGVDARDMIAQSTFIQRSRGEYAYSSLDRFLRDITPDVLAQRNANARLYVGNNYQLNFYVNDNWKIRRNLAFNLGLRYEYTTVPRSMQEFELNAIADVPGVITFAAPQPQTANFAPRVGFAFSPGSSARTSVRGGFGIGYDVIFDNVGTTVRPPQATTTVTETSKNNNPGYLANGAIPPTVPNTNTAASYRGNTTGYLQPDQKLGYAINWNLGIQRSFGKDYTAEIRYLGTRGVHLLFQTWLNASAIVTADHNLPLFFSQPSQATLDALPLTLTQLGAERASSLGNPLLPYGFPKQISAILPKGNSEYHGLALDVNKRFSRNLLFKGAYTWSHLMDDSTAEVNSTTLSPRRPEDFDNIRKEWATSLLDRRHRLTFALQYRTSWLQENSNPVLRNILGNWQLAGAYIYESPEYATPQSVSDANQNGDAATDRVVINPNGKPGSSSDITALPSNRGGVAEIVAYRVNDPNAYYIRAAPGVYTTSGRNILKMRPIDNFDLSIAKVVPFMERYRFEIRVDMYNAFNHPQYTPGRVNRVDSFGHANETNYLTPGTEVFAQWDKVMPSNARQIQLTAKIKF